MQRFDPKLRCVITLAKDHALEQARQADKEIAAGKYRGPLHGIPWGAKDLLDTAGIRDDVGRGALSGSYPDEGCGGRRPAECGRSGAGRQAEPGCAGAERYLVRRADDESVVAGRRLVAWIGNGHWCWRRRRGCEADVRKTRVHSAHLRVSEHDRALSWRHSLNGQPRWIWLRIHLG